MLKKIKRFVIIHDEALAVMAGAFITTAFMAWLYEKQLKNQSVCCGKFINNVDTGLTATFELIFKDDSRLYFDNPEVQARK